MVLRGNTVQDRKYICMWSASIEIDTDTDTFANQSNVRGYSWGIFSQVVLSRRLHIPFSGDPFPIYRALRIINPSPYLFYLDLGKYDWLVPPEVLVRVQERVVSVMPIAGTCKTRSERERRQTAGRTTYGNEKEAAEHVMLVRPWKKWYRRVSEYGSVHVPYFKPPEAFSHVIHYGVGSAGDTGNQGTIVWIHSKHVFSAGTVSGRLK